MILQDVHTVRQEKKAKVEKKMSKHNEKINQKEIIRQQKIEKKNKIQIEESKEVLRKTSTVQDELDLKKPRPSLTRPV